MATTPVIPISAPAAAAPAPAPAPAPSAAPPAASPASAALSTPAPAATTATPAAGVSPSSTTPHPPAKLNPGEFGNATDSYMAEVQWKQDLAAFKAENPGVEVPDDSPWAGTEAPATETPAAEPGTEIPATETEAASTETPAVDPDAEQFSLDDGPATLTPQALNDLFKGDEALKAAVEANPAAKGALFKMAREHAELSQFKGIFPNKDAATFAKNEATWVTSISSQIQIAETPQQMDKAIDTLMERFALTDAQGNPIIGSDGTQEYAEDGYNFAERWVERYADGTLESVDARLAANKYTDDAARERDNDLKLALSIIKDDLHPAEPAARVDPDLSHLDEKTRNDVQARLDEAKRIEAANDAAKAGSKKQSRDQVREEGNNKFYADAGKRAFTQARAIVDKLRSAGAVIPQWQLDAKVPGQSYTAFDNEVGVAIESYIKADPYESKKQMQFELQYIANPTPENLQARISAFGSILQTKDDTGKSLLNRIVTKLVRQYGQQVATAAEAQAGSDTAPHASTEPKPGPAVKPQQMSADDAYREAQKQLATEVKEWNNLSPSEQMSQALARQRKILTTR